MNENQFQDRFEDEGSSDFERRLREFQPTPPRTSWEDIERSISLDQQVTVRRTPPSSWSKMATHAAATLAGVALGVALMLMLKNDGAPEVVLDSDVREQVVEEPVDSDRQKTTLLQNKVAVNRHRNSSSSDRSVFRSARALRSGPLTPLHRNIDLQPWQNVSYDRMTFTAEPSSTSIEPSDFVQPMAAPQLLRQLLDEQSKSSNQRGNKTNSG